MFLLETQASGWACATQGAGACRPRLGFGIMLRLRDNGLRTTVDRQRALLGVDICLAGGDSVALHDEADGRPRRPCRRQYAADVLWPKTVDVYSLIRYRDKENMLTPESDPTRASAVGCPTMPSHQYEGRGVTAAETWSCIQTDTTLIVQR